MHVQIDPLPHVLEDEIGLKLVAPDDGWRLRPDMDPQFTRLFRASIVARARFIEDLVVEQSGRGVSQYVVLGAGLDTFAQRRPEIASRLRIFEIDQPGPQAWKRQRLIELGFGVPEWLRLVPVDFEAGGSWWERLAAAGFDAGQPAVVASTGVSMYLTKEAIMATLHQVNAFIGAGAQSVVSTLWEVEDRATAKFMIDFYRQLGKGEGKAEALRQAQLDMLHSGAPPYYWAGFELVGEPTGGLFNASGIESSFRSGR